MKRRGVEVAVIVVATVLIGVCGALTATAETPPGPARARQTCGPAGGETLATAPHARVYRTKEPHSGSEVYGCLEGFRPRRLDLPRKPEPSWEYTASPWVDGELVAFNGPWVAYRENFVFVDTGIQGVGLVNLRTGTARHCLVGRWSSNNGFGFWMTGLVVTERGSASWIGEQRSVQENLREVHDCEGARLKVLDEGAEIKLRSLRLDGHILSWTDEGASRSAQLR